MCEPQRLTPAEEKEAFVFWLEEMVTEMTAVVEKPGFLELGAVDTLRLRGVVERRLREERLTPTERHEQLRAAAQTARTILAEISTAPDADRAQIIVSAGNAFLLLDLALDTTEG